jgi:hypothetical protein
VAGFGFRLALLAAFGVAVLELGREGTGGSTTFVCLVVTTMVGGVNTGAVVPVQCRYTRRFATCSVKRLEE